MRVAKIVSCAVVAWLSVSVLASVQNAPSVIVSSDFLSEYIWRGQNVVDDWVAQPNVSLAYKGFTGSIWGNLDLTGAFVDGGEFNEFDYTLDYMAAVPGQDLLSFSLGVIYYRFPNTVFKPTTELYGGLSAALPLSPAIKIFRDVDEIDGSYIQLSLGHTIEKLQKWTEDCYCGLQLGAGLAYGTSSYNEGYFGLEHGGFNDLTLSAALPICLGRWTIKPILAYSTLLDSDVRAATAKSDNLYGGIGLAYRF